MTIGETAATPAATPEDRLYAIVEHGLCLGCGLCQSVAGPDNITVTKVKNGAERPVVVGTLDHPTVDRIYDVCPGVRIDGMPAENIDGNTIIDPVWGPVRRMVHGWAGDPTVRHVASTGGVLSALAQFLLTSGRVDFILHAKASTTEPSFGTPHLSFTVDDVMIGAGSRYGPTAVLINVRDVLDRGQPFAFIGKPCDIAALRNYGRHDARVAELVKYYLTPVCGGFMQPAGMDAFMQRNDIDKSAVTAIRYRGYGNPGPTRFEMGESALELHYLDMWGEDESQWHLSMRCKLCPDGIGEAADIAASDTWVGGAPNRVDSETDLGVNGIIARSAAGMELLEAAIAAGAIVTGDEITPDEMTAYQPHQMRKKYAVAGRHAALETSGRVTITATDLRIAELSASLPAEHFAFQHDGTMQRIAAGKADEDRPETLV